MYNTYTTKASFLYVSTALFPYAASARVILRQLKFTLGSQSLKSSQNVYILYSVHMYTECIQHKGLGLQYT